MVYIMIYAGISIGIMLLCAIFAALGFWVGSSGKIFVKERTAVMSDEEQKNVDKIKREYENFLRYDGTPQ